MRKRKEFKEEETEENMPRVRGHIRNVNTGFFSSTRVRVRGHIRRRPTSSRRIRR